ncbi:streptophobe family protein [Streptomyces sp. 378]|uniref:streptophobe family protein n=1 Tax=Streptomyces sp. 378 TaxID=3049412 RepID=UPI0024C39C42|nr:streptophobe family protein [Streptomyces sp. 378]MDK1346160.1 streptophobe family protein [Streptomyces sp. 378]
MSAVTGRTSGHARVPWGDVLLSAVAAVSWALIGMAGTAALGLRLLEADTAGSLGPMTAAVVALGAGGSVTPSGDVSAFGLTGAEADTAIEITPLGVSLVGALLLSWFFLRSLRAAGVVISPAELLARAGTVVALFVAMLGGLAWAGHDVITIDGGSLGLDDVTGGNGSVDIPGLGDIGGLLPDRLGDLVDAQAAVGFTVDTAPTLLGGLGWSAGILVIALLASRRTPLPPGWEAVHRVVRPAVSAVVTVLLVAVVAGLAVAGYAAIGDDHPARIAGAALLGAPNGVWLGIPIGLFVSWDGRATGELTRFLPDPLDDLLGAGADQPVTLGRLAELDGRVWLLGVAAALTMLLAGVLAGVRTPVGEGWGGLRFASRCALRLGVATALTLPLLAWLTDVSVTASLSVLGFDAFGAGIDLHGHLGAALLLGGVWGAGAGAVGASLAWMCGAAGRRATASARGEGFAGAAGAEGLASAGWAEHGGGSGRTEGLASGGWAEHGAGAGRGETWSGSGTAGYDVGGGRGWPGPGDTTRRTGNDPGTEQTEAPGAPRPTGHDDNTAQPWPRPGDTTQRTGNDPHTGQTETPAVPGPDGVPRRGDAVRRPGNGPGAGWPGARGGWVAEGEEAGPYAPGTPYRPPNPGTNPYLRVPDGLWEPEDARPPGTERPLAAGSGPGPDHGTSADEEPPAAGDVHGAPTVVRPVGPPPRGPRQAPGPRTGNGPPARPDDGPPPPPPPPPRKPRGGR